MRYYWLRDREKQQQFNIYWQRGLDNHADYFTKHHATAHHRQTRAQYVRDKIACLTSRIENVFNNNYFYNDSTIGMSLNSYVNLGNNIYYYFNSKDHPNNHPTVYCGFRFIRQSR